MPVKIWHEVFPLICHPSLPHTKENPHRRIQRARGVYKLDSKVTFIWPCDCQRHSDRMSKISQDDLLKKKENTHTHSEISSSITRTICCNYNLQIMQLSNVYHMTGFSFYTSPPCPYIIPFKSQRLTKLTRKPILVFSFKMPIMSAKKKTNLHSL